MKSDLDSLMTAQGLDAIIVVGPAQNNPPMVYFTGVAHLTQAVLIKLRGEVPVLYHVPMERDEAARSGLRTVTLDVPVLDALARQKDGDYAFAYAGLYHKMFTDLGLTRGRVSLYGLTDVGQTYAIFSELQKLAPEIQVVGEVNRSVLLSAMETKSSDEVEHIRHMGEKATSVMHKVAEFLSSQPVRNQVLVKADGEPLTIGDVKRRINLWIAESGAETPRNTIFAIGYDSAVPHSIGTLSDPLHLGQTIIFDFYPREPGGGYFYDITRTWCLGFAPDEALGLYEDVWHTFQELRAALRPGALGRDLQLLACDLFEQRGHPTLHSDPNTINGYVHGLGHGLGLNVHELPRMRAESSAEERLLPGAVFTLEPGLYYPERKMGMRVEDTFWARPDGVFETLADFPYDLVLPVKS